MTAFGSHQELAIERPVLDRLSDVRGPRLCGHFEDAVVGVGAELEVLIACRSISCPELSGAQNFLI